MKRAALLVSALLALALFFLGLRIVFGEPSSQPPKRLHPAPAAPQPDTAMQGVSSAADGALVRTTPSRGFLIRAVDEQHTAVANATFVVDGVEHATGTDGIAWFASAPQHVVARHASYVEASADISPVDLAAGERDIVLAKSASLSGVVIDDAGAPMAEASVILRDPRKGESEAGATRSTTSAVDGRFRIPVPHGGRWLATVEKSGYVCSIDGGKGKPTRVAAFEIVGDVGPVQLVLLPVIVAVVGFVNLSTLPAERVGDHVAISRTIPPTLVELTPDERAIEADAIRAVRARCPEFGHVSVWCGRRRVGAVPRVLRASVVQFGGTDQAMDIPCVPLVAFTRADAARVDFRQTWEWGMLAVRTNFPAIAYFVKDGVRTVWQVPFEPDAIGAPRGLPVGRWSIEPSPATLLTKGGRTKDVVVTADATVVCDVSSDTAVRFTVQAIRDSKPAALGPLTLKITGPGGYVSLRGLPGDEVCLFGDAGTYSILVRDASNTLLGRLTTDLPDPTGNTVSVALR